MNKMTKSISLKPMIVPRNKSMGRQQCKKHPKHRQSPGVCSLCLSEKLAKVSLATTTCRSYDYHSSAVSSSVSSTSYESSYASSTAASPPHSTARHRRMVSDVYTNDANEEDVRLLLSKFKSMAHVENKLGSLEKKNKKKNNNGVSKVWANLLRLGRLSNDQKRVNVEDNHRKTALVTSQPFASSSTMVLAS